MSNNGDLELRMFFHGASESGAAVLVGNHPVKESSRTWWLPRSLISYARKDGAKEPGHAPGYVFALPEWKVDEAGLWEFVTD
jgi:hypothetical protein